MPLTVSRGCYAYKSPSCFASISSWHSRRMTGIGSATFILAVLCAALAEGATVLSKNGHQKSPFSDYVVENGKKIQVADPMDDPNESESVDGSKDEWQTEIMKELLNQRKVEMDFINKLEVGGKNLDTMVKTILKSFNELEAARKRKGIALIKKHLQNEMQFLIKSQKTLGSDFAPLLALNVSDSAAMMSLKSKIKIKLDEAFRKQIKSQENILKEEISDIKSEHKEQHKNVQSVYALIKRWRDTFHTGIQRSKKRLTEIMQSWEML